MVEQKLNECLMNRQIYLRLFVVRTKVVRIKIRAPNGNRKEIKNKNEFQLVFFEFEFSNKTFFEEIEFVRIFKFTEIETFHWMKKKLAKNRSMVAEILSNSVNRSNVIQKVILISFSN